MAPIKDLQLTYEAPNPENAFSAGDVITGIVTFTVTRETKVQSLQVKLKGDAYAGVREAKGIVKFYSDHKRFFKVKQNVVAENLKADVLPCAVHSFHFKLRIPQRNMPPSFKGDDARIVYMLEAKVFWGWWQISTVAKELKVLSSPPVAAQANLPLARIASERVGFFSKRLVRLSAALQKRVYSPGDTVSVVAKITNSSSRRMMPKFNLLQTTTCCVGEHTHTDKILYEAVGKTIKENTEETITCHIKIPVDASPTFFNRELISVTYKLKVYAGGSFADLPVVTLPLFIVPHRYASQQSCGLAIDVEALLHRDLLLPAFGVGSGVVPASQNAFEYPEPDPTQRANTSDNQWSLLVPPHSPPQSPPPSYDSLYPTPPDVNGTNRQVKTSKL